MTGGTPPRGVRILHPDGSETACGVDRAGEDTPDGLALWFVVPPGGVQFDPGRGDRLAVEALPGRTALGFQASFVAEPPPVPLPMKQ